MKLACIWILMVSISCSCLSPSWLCEYPLSFLLFNRDRILEPFSFFLSSRKYTSTLVAKHGLKDWKKKKKGKETCTDQGGIGLNGRNAFTYSGLIIKERFYFPFFIVRHSHATVERVRKYPAKAIDAINIS